MTQINLLPWRETLRETQKKKFLFELGIAATATLVVVFIIHVGLQGRASYRQSKVTYLQTGIQEQQARLDKLKADKEEVTKLYDQLVFLTALKQSNYNHIHFYNELMRAIPNDVTLVKIVSDNNQYTIDGIAQSNLEITSFVKNLSRIATFKDTKLNRIMVKEESDASKKFFQLLVRPKEPTE